MDLVPVEHNPFPAGVTGVVPVDHDPFNPLAPQGSVAAQVAGFPQRAADFGMAALGPIGEAGMTVGDMLRTGHVDPRDIPQVVGGVMMGVAAPEAGEAEAAVPSVANIIKGAEPEMVGAFNKALPSIKDQYYRWAGANHSYEELTPDTANQIYGDELPDDLQSILDSHGRAVEIGSENSAPEYFDPISAPTRDEHMQSVVENEGGLVPVQSLDEVYGALKDGAGIDPIIANSEALKVLARKLGWNPTNGLKYFSLEKNGYPNLDVRVSDHGNLTRSNPNATRPDINLAPGAHDFHDAASIMMDQEAEEAAPLEAGGAHFATQPVDHDPFAQ